MRRRKGRGQDARQDDGRVAQQRNKLPRFPSIHLFVGITHSEREESRGGVSSAVARFSVIRGQESP